MDESALRERARSYFDGVSPCHDFQHVRRVVATAKRLADETAASEQDPASDVDPSTDVDGDVLVAAAWLHDVGRGKETRGEIDDHAEWGASEAKRILAERHDETSEWPRDRREHVAQCVRAHRYSNDVEPASLEAELLADADNLDATGAVGIARVFAYAGEHERTLYDPDRPPHEDETPAGETSFNHFHKKILTLADRMYTAAGRELAADRQAYVEDYLDRFEREATGQD